MLAFAAVISTIHLEGDVTAAGGDFVEVPFEVPANTAEITVSHTDGDPDVILDFGVWSPEGFRGWGGGNTEDAIIGVAQSSRSYLSGAITAGAGWRVVIGKAQLKAGAGHYSIDITFDDTASLTPKPMAEFSPVVLSTERRWYKGDFHVHSEESGDASATFDDINALAMQRGLDFVNLSDHNTSSQLSLIAAAQPDYAVLLLRGAEITTYAGHGNAVGLPSYVDHRIGFEGRTITNVLDDVAAQDAIFIVNHPALDLGDQCIGCAWNHETTPWDKVSGLEVITGKWDLVESLFTPRAIEMWDEQLSAGHRIAAIGGSDDHSAGEGTGLTDTPIGSPTTLVLADELSEAAIVAAIRKGRTMVMLRGPDDPFVDVHLETADGALAEIGDDVDNIATASFPLTITGGNGSTAQLWRDGVLIDEVAVDSDSFTHTFRDAPGAADHRYRIEMINDGGKRIVVTSHFYVHGIAGDGGGCGCQSNDPSGALWLLLALATTCRRSVRRARPYLDSCLRRSTRGAGASAG